MGFREFGVSSGGALDSFGLRVTNLLVGNDEGAAGLEITLGGLQLGFENEHVVAWCGGEFDVQIAINSIICWPRCACGSRRTIAIRSASNWLSLLVRGLRRN